MSELPPHQRGSETSRAAAVSVKEAVPSMKQTVLDAIIFAGPPGATCDELERVLGMKHQTVSARIRGLFIDGRIEDKGYKRNTSSGRKAVAWVARPQGRLF